MIELNCIKQTNNKQNQLIYIVNMHHSHLKNK